MAADQITFARPCVPEQAGIVLELDSCAKSVKLLDPFGMHHSQ